MAPGVSEVSGDNNISDDWPGTLQEGKVRLFEVTKNFSDAMFYQFCPPLPLDGSI